MANYIPVLTGSGDDTIDLFHGFGGWSIAAKKVGLWIKWALNHDEHKVRVHAENFPETTHHQADVRHTDPKQHPRTRIFLGSPACDDFTQAKTHKTKLLHEQQMRLFYEDEREREKAIAERQKRATMWNVIDFIAAHRYQIGAIENVVDVHRWGMFDEWVNDLRNLGYNYKMLYLNSMFFHDLNGVEGIPPAPQSRDRWYCVFWRKGTPAPDLEFRPLAPCPNCGRDVRAVQIWKNPERQYGKYGIKTGSYYYGCPTCTEKYNGRLRPLPLHPYYYCGLNALDLSIPIQRVADFKKPISANSRARIAAGLQMFGGDPYLMNGNMWKYRSALLSPTFTQTTGHHQFIVIPPMILNHTRCHPATSSLDEMPTQTGTRTLAAVMPTAFISALDPGDNHETRVRCMLDALPTQTCWKNQTALAALPVLIELGHSNSERSGKVQSAVDVWPTQTIKNTLGVFWPTWFVELYGGGTVRSTFDEAQTVTAGGGKHGLVIPPFVTTYNGNSVYAGMNDPLPTATRNERYGLVFPTPQSVEVDDCYYRTLRSIYEVQVEHGAKSNRSEIGRVMGFPDEFQFFGTVDQVTEGFGGAITPGKGSWIVKRIAKVLD
jgi:DNA (cytosine-5)-methyltransferase 1